VCKAFKHYTIVPEKCVGCGACAKKCRSQAISGIIKNPFQINQDLCIKCGVCKETCRFDAIEVR